MTGDKPKKPHKDAWKAQLITPLEVDTKLRLIGWRIVAKQGRRVSMVSALYARRELAEHSLQRLRASVNPADEVTLILVPAYDWRDFCYASTRN